MLHACTYFDRGYLAQGLAMWRSFEEQLADSILWVLTLDDETAGILRAIGGPRLRILPLAELLAADAELVGVREKRARQEFIFTLTPCLVGYLLRKYPQIERLVYLDADLFFFGDPGSILREWADGSIFIVSHQYPLWHDDSAYYGRYNVGVLGFKNDSAALTCVEWWRSRCLDSCALDADGAHFGDQKYLDEWPHRFAGVVESTHPGINCAPWNWAAQRLEISSAKDVKVNGAPLIVFHFAQFKRISERWFDSGQLEYGIMPRALRTRIYGPYWQALDNAEKAIRWVSPQFAIPRRGWSIFRGSWRVILLRLFWGQYWWRAGSHWIAGRCGVGQFSGRAMGRYRRWQRARV